MKRLIYIVLLSCVVNLAYAVIATPEPLLRQLPDGTWMKVYLHGDENYHYLTTLTGERIPGTELGDVPMELGSIYASRAPQAEMLDSKVPSRGKVKVPVILLNYKDLSFTMVNPQDDFSDFYNGAGGTNRNATGSVHDYFVCASDSLLDLEFDVYGPYTVSKDMAYYGGNTSSSHMKNVDDLVHEAAQLASEAGVDFSRYDNDNDGVVDNLSIVVAGYNEAEGGDENTIWPHYSQVYGSKSYSGKKIIGYLVISEYRGSGGKQQAGIGTYCHEFGHALGLPDLYDTQNSSRYTVGTWDIMCSGSYNNNGCTPPSYSAFERFAMGWLTPIQLKEVGDYTLQPLIESNTAYLIAADEHNLSSMSPSPNEYFLLENRQAVGWDANTEALVGTGMLVSHITFNHNTWNRNTFNNGNILGYAIVGAYDSSPNQSTPLDLFPGKAKITSWLPTLNNSTQLIDQQVQNIKERGDLSIRFSFGPPTKDGIFFSSDTIQTLVTTYDAKAYEYDTAQIDVVVRNMPNDTLLIYATNDYFECSIDSGLSWGDNKTHVLQPIPNDSVFTFHVLIRHTPHRQDCNVKSGFITVESMHSFKMQQLEVNGYSPRPVYISKPELLQPDNISTTSFRAHWVVQEDAEYYYLTLFSLLNQPQVDVEKFDDFDSNSLIEQSGWMSNFVRTTSIMSESKLAVKFMNTGEYVLSKEYLLPPDSLRFWISNDYVFVSGETQGGTMLLEGRAANGKWMKIDNIRIMNTTRDLVKKYALSPKDAFIQFRFTYTYKAGEGGVALDGFEAHMDKTIQYVSQGTQLEVPGIMNEAIMADLKPNTTYYFAVQAYEHKSCNENYSKLSDFQEIRTLNKIEETPSLKVIRSNDGICVVQLPDMADGLSDLYVYTAQGTLVAIIDVPYATMQVALPDLQDNTMYLLKLSNKKINRKDASGKFVTF